MEVKSVSTKHTVEDFDITYTNGFLMCLTIDEKAGDSIDYDPTKSYAIFRTHETPLGKPDAKPICNDLTVLMSNVLCIQHRTREVEDITPEQKELFTQALKEFSGSPKKH